MPAAPTRPTLPRGTDPRPMVTVRVTRPWGIPPVRLVRPASIPLLVKPPTPPVPTATTSPPALEQMHLVSPPPTRVWEIRATPAAMSAKISRSGYSATHLETGHATRRLVPNPTQGLHPVRGVSPLASGRWPAGI